MRGAVKIRWASRRRASSYRAMPINRSKSCWSKFIWSTSSWFDLSNAPRFPMCNRARRDHYCGVEAHQMSLSFWQGNKVGWPSNPFARRRAMRHTRGRYGLFCEYPNAVVSCALRPVSIARRRCSSGLPAGVGPSHLCRSPRFAHRVRRLAAGAGWSSVTELAHRHDAAASAVDAHRGRFADAAAGAACFGRSQVLRAFGR